MELQENQVQYTNSSELILLLYATTYPICFVQALPLYRFCGMYYILGYYIFGWVVPTGNVITENLIIVWQFLITC